MNLNKFATLLLSKGVTLSTDKQHALHLHTFSSSSSSPPYNIFFEQKPLVLRLLINFEQPSIHSFFIFLLMCKEEEEEAEEHEKSRMVFFWLQQNDNIFFWLPRNLFKSYPRSVKNNSRNYQKNNG